MSIHTALNSVPDSWDEVDQLIRLLSRWGVTYLVGLEHTNNPAHQEEMQLSPVALMQRLAQCDEFPRVRDASIALFLLHPELADSIIEALQTAKPAVAEQIATLTLATLYLQHLWSIRLTPALGHAPCFPEQRFAPLWQSRQLPPPASHYGTWGLLALQEAEQARTGLPFSFLGDWQNQIDHLLRQEEAKHHQLLTSITIPTDEAPVNFIPLPSQWETCASYVGRYGGIDVFYFDFYSIALSKIERGNNRDIADIRLLVQEKIITLQELDVSYQEVLAQLGKGRYPRITPQRFSERYQAIRMLLYSLGGTSLFLLFFKLLILIPIIIDILGITCVGAHPYAWRVDNG